MGYKVFYDIESLSSGKFNAKLLEVIDECNDVLVILPPNSLERCVNEDDWLRLEVAYAIRQGKNIIPIMMKGFEWGKNIPEDIKELKNYNGVIVTFDFFEGVLARIIKYLTNSSKEKMITEKKSHILFWADFDDAIIEKIVNKLKLDDYFIEIMSEPVEILSKNLQEIYAIILIVTDCTKFSSNIYAAKRINETLVHTMSSTEGPRMSCCKTCLDVRSLILSRQKRYITIRRRNAWKKTDSAICRKILCFMTQKYAGEKLQKMLMCILKQSRGSHLYFPENTEMVCVSF